MLAERIRTRAAEIAQKTGTQIELKRVAHHAPSLATPGVQESIEAVCAALGLKTRRMPSGAGHDAQSMATLGAMGMIFVPSVAGISHSPKELTHWEDCANGANVLMRAVLAQAG